MVIRVNNKLKTFNFNLIFNIINVLISSLILMIPMIIFAINYQNQPNSYDLFRPGFDQTRNLILSIVMTIVSISLICANGYRMWENFKTLINKKWFNKDYKWVTSLVMISVIGLILYLVAFFTIWLYSMPNVNTNQIATYNWKRLLAYIITYCVLTFCILMLLIMLSILTKKRIIQHSNNSESAKNG